MSNSKGYVITVFAELLQKLWLGTSTSVTPREFKSIVENFATIFRGYEQHDSQEFFVLSKFISFSFFRLHYLM